MVYICIATTEQRGTVFTAVMGFESYILFFYGQILTLKADPFSQRTQPNNMTQGQHSYSTLTQTLYILFEFKFNFF